MAWPNIFKSDDENTRHTYGYHFQWTPNHYTPEGLKPMMHTYDTLGEAALNALDRISPPPNNALPRRNDYTAKPKASNGDVKENGEKKEKEPDFTPKRDLYALLRDHHEEDESLSELWTQINTIPDWVDWDQIARGQEVFYRYGEAALTSVSSASSLNFTGHFHGSLACVV